MLLFKGYCLKATEVYSPQLHSDLKTVIQCRFNQDNALELRYESLKCNKSAPFIRNS
jgi:hypothetical protein